MNRETVKEIARIITRCLDTENGGKTYDCDLHEWVDIFPPERKGTKK